MAVVWERGPDLPSEDWAYSIRQSPLVPVAFLLSVGMLADRLAIVPIQAALFLGGVSLVAWAIVRTKSYGLSLVYLAMAVFALGAARHHLARQVSADDISHLVGDEPVPIQVRGVVAEDPYLSPAIRKHPLRTKDRESMHLGILRVTHWRQRDDWLETSGHVFLTILGEVPELRVGDEVEVHGQLAPPECPKNPGETDRTDELLDDGIRATLFVRSPSRAFTKLNEADPRTFRGWLAWLRAQGRDAVLGYLPGPTGEIAAALLLGERSALRAEEWENYLRTGVIAVLVISGQHLLMLAIFLELVLRLVDVRLRTRAGLVATLILLYALFTGGRPPGMRAALVVLAAAGAVVFSRRSRPINLLAAAWIVLALWNPSDIFSPGCQMSFLAVVVLCWWGRRTSPPQQDPIDELVERTRPKWLRLLKQFARWFGTMYVVGLVLWITLTPLAASNYHLVAPAGLLLGPPLALLTMTALLVGFVFLVCVVVMPPLATLLASPLHALLALSRGTVQTVEAWPGSHFYIADLPTWWLVAFYVGLAFCLTRTPTPKALRWMGLAACAWFVVGLASPIFRPKPEALRCTFLSVGHGGCIVLETPDGRVLLYDTGAIRGPQVAARQIAPYLWSRGIRRIDEVFLSHADLDHFNGLPALLDRFSVGRITCNPTFDQKESPAVKYTLEAIRRHAVPMRTAHLGQLFEAGDVSLEVLHPPAKGPAGSENARSLVLLVRHHANTILLTGDLEAPGVKRFLSLPPPKVDVLMAPHHGSVRLDVKGILDTVKPHVVISSQGYRPPRRSSDDPYRGVNFYSTEVHGAITLTSESAGIRLETHSTKKSLVLAK